MRLAKGTSVQKPLWAQRTHPGSAQSESLLHTGPCVFGTHLPLGAGDGPGVGAGDGPGDGPGAGPVPPQVEAKELWGVMCHLPEVSRHAVSSTCP